MTGPGLAAAGSLPACAPASLLLLANGFEVLPAKVRLEAGPDMTSPCVGDIGEAVGTLEGACCTAASGAVVSCTMAPALTLALHKCNATQIINVSTTMIANLGLTSQQKEVVMCNAVKQCHHNGIQECGTPQNCDSDAEQQDKAGARYSLNQQICIPEQYLQAFKAQLVAV